MSKLTGMLAALVVYLCIGTVIAQAIGVAYAWTHGYLERDKLLEMVAVAHGKTDRQTKILDEHEKETTSEQPSFEDIEQARAIHTRNLELREQAVREALDRIGYDQRQLTDEKESFDRVRVAFEKQLKLDREGALAEGRANVRTIWENIKPKLAKEQILQMLDKGEEKEVVAILAEMPITKRAKICAEFSKTEEELIKLDSLLRLIREGVPETAAIETAQNGLDDIRPE